MSAASTLLDSSYLDPADPLDTEPPPTLAEWVVEVGGIAHREAAANAGYPRVLQHAATREGSLRAIRRKWLAAPSAPAGLVAAAENSASLACISAARHRGWWIPEGADDRIHLRLAPHSASPVREVVAHWTARIAPAPGRGLVESIEDSLAHVARCLPPEQALIVWESAMRVEDLSLDALRRVAWPTRAARECAQQVTGLSDSGLETIAVVRLSGWGIPIRQQVVLAGRPVDLLVGDRLVVQIDGFAHHSTSAQRSKDVEFDAELTLRGYTVLRFTYAQVVHHWDDVERIIARAVAAGAHLAH